MAAHIRRYDLTKTEPVLLTFMLKRQLLSDLLCTAVEGGSNYWATFHDAELTEGQDYVAVKVTYEDGDGHKVTKRVRCLDLMQGLKRLAACTDPKFPAALTHLNDAVTEQGDAATADVVLQMTLMGELVYG